MHRSLIKLLRENWLRAGSPPWGLFEVEGVVAPLSVLLFVVLAALWMFLNQ
jgi:hypothetical protein